MCQAVGTSAPPEAFVFQAFAVSLSSVEMAGIPLRAFPPAAPNRPPIAAASKRGRAPAQGIGPFTLSSSGLSGLHIHQDEPPGSQSIGVE